MTSSDLGEQLPRRGVLVTAMQGTGQRGEAEAMSDAPDREFWSLTEKLFRLLVIRHIPKIVSRGSAAPG